MYMECVRNTSRMLMKDASCGFIYLILISKLPTFCTWAVSVLYSVCDGLHWGDDCSQLCNCTEHASSCSNSQGCVCKPGWTGEQCDTDVKECGTVSCGYQRECIDTPGSYRCQCRAGYTEEAGQCTGGYIHAVFCLFFQMVLNRIMATF